MSLQKMEAERHRLRRLRILQALQMNRPNPMGDGLIGQVLKQDVDLEFTQSSIRKGLEYLEGRGLVTIVSQSDERWVVRISADGIDYLDGHGADIPGVARPSDF